jgi:retinol dehydrogenase-12
MSGSKKHAVITGATQGIGLETAKALVARGWRITLVGRDPVAMKRVQGELGGPPVVRTRQCDLTLMRQVRQLGEELVAEGEPIHALINNAGAYFHPRQLTAEGVEKTWALNHLAVFGLTSLVVPLLQKAAKTGDPARVVVVSSNAHTMARKPPLEDLEYSNGYRAMQAYARSKLANIWFAREQARRWADAGVTGITINTVHPGVVATKFFQGNGFFGWFWRTLLNFVAITPEEGAEGLVRLATDPALAGVTGRYFSRLEEKEPSALAQDPEWAQSVWQATEKRWLETAGI